jgi:hypothetical protein
MKRETMSKAKKIPNIDEQLGESLHCLPDKGK